jgi:hypothetical protein
MAFSPLPSNRAPARPPTAFAASQMAKASHTESSLNRASAAHSSAVRGALWETPCLSLFSFAGIEEWRGVKRGGDVTKILDKSIGKRAYVIKGPIASSNYIEMPHPEAAQPKDRAPINATGPFVYVEYKPIPGLPPGAMVLFHLDLTTSAGALRVSCSSTFSECKIAGAGTLRVPLRPSLDGRWTVMALDLPALLAQHCPKTSSRGGSSSTSVTYRALRAVKLCSNMVVRGVYTSHNALNPSTLPADMKLPLPKEGSWHESYAWVWCPQPPSISTQSSDNNNNDASSSNTMPPSTPNQRRARAAVPASAHGALESSYDARESDDYTAARYTTTPPAAAQPRFSPRTNRTVPSTRTVPPPAFPAPTNLSSISQRFSNGTTHQASYKLIRVVGNSAVGAGGSSNGSSSSSGGCSGKSVAWVKSDEVVFPCGGVIVAMDARAPEAGGLGNQRFLTASQQPPPSNASTVKCLCVSHHAPLLAVVSSQGGTSGSDSSTSSSSSSSCLWDLAGQKCLCDFGSSSYASALVTCSFSACDRSLVTVGHDAQRRTLLMVWSVTQLRRGSELGGSGSVSCGPVLTRQATVARQLSDFDVTSIAFHPHDHTRLVSCGRENVRFWRVSRKHLPGSPAEVPKSLGLEFPFRGHNFAALTFEAKEPPPPPLVAASSSAAGESTSIAATVATTKVVFVASDQGCLLQVDATSRQILSFLGLHSAPITCVVASEG